jgi:ABC-2 type transport system permease protein
MSGTIFMDTLRRNWRGMLFWGLGIAFVAWLEIIILPDVDSLQQMAELMETLPPIFLQMFGGSNDPSFLSTPEGYLNFRFFGILPLFLSVYVVAAGLGITASEEDQGILDMVLSLPVPRWRLVIERFLAYSLLLCGILFLSFIGLWIGIAMTPIFAIPVPMLLVATFNVLPLLLTILAFTLLMATLLRRRGQALAAASAFVVGAYILDTLGKAATENVVNQLSRLSVFSYYDTTSILQGGDPAWGNLGLLVVVTLLLWAGAVWLFQRRDIGV